MDHDHFFIGANALLIVVLLCLCLVVGHVLKKANFHYLPESGASMLLGMLAGGLVLLFGTEESEAVWFKPNVFFYVLLPPIIFEAGYTMKQARFFSNFWTILVFAVLGTMVTALVIGFGLWGFAVAGWVPLDKDSPLECLTYGSLLSAVDPVATLAILGSPHINADPTMYFLVFGESMLNDAVAIALYNTFNSFSSQNFQAVTVWEAVGEFIGVSIGSLFLGILVALACSFVLKHSNLEDVPHYEFTVMLLVAYSSYCLAEVAQLSGIISLFFCGIVMAHYASYNVSTAARTTFYHGFKGITLICETFLFAYLGITAIVGIQAEFHLSWNVQLCAATILMCLVSRAVNVFPFSCLLNIGRKQKITFKMQIVMWFAGLRGAIAFALALNWDTPNRPVVVTSTIVTVIFTTLVQGGLTAPLVRCLGLSRPHDDENEAPLVDELGSPRPFYSPRGKKGGLHDKWRRFDEKYMKKWFGGRPRPRNPDEEEPIAIDDVKPRTTHVNSSYQSVDSSPVPPLLGSGAVDSSNYVGLPAEPDAI